MIPSYLPHVGVFLVTGVITFAVKVEQGKAYSFWLCCGAAGLAFVAAGFMVVGSNSGNTTEGQANHTPFAPPQQLGVQYVNHVPPTGLANEGLRDIP